MIRTTIAAAALAATPLVVQAQTAASTLTPYALTSRTYSQNFDTLAATGSSNVLPADFQIVENGTAKAVDGAYTAGTGSSNTGDAYSFGAAGGSNRALGSLTSGTNSPIEFGGVFTNGLGATITSIALAYTGEQWRLANGVGDALTFEYSTNATSLTTGTWTRASALDFAAPFSNGTSSGAAVDGASAAYQRAIAGTLSGLSIAAGGTFAFRWTDVDVTGSDQGLAVDDLSLTATLASVTGAVPEPSSWATMTLGFGLLGGALRRRRRVVGATATA